MERCVGICCFGGFFDGSFSDVLIYAGFLVRNFVLPVLGFARNYLPEYAPEFFFLRQALFLWPSLIRTTDFWLLPVELFLWKVLSHLVKVEFCLN